MHSQIISKTAPRVTAVINSNGDTLIQMNLADAKQVLSVILDKPIVDSLLKTYEGKDIEKNGVISLQKYQIAQLELKSSNQAIYAANLATIVNNKDVEIKDLNDIIKKQKREIRKQKILKIIGFTAAVALPITTIILMSK